MVYEGTNLRTKQIVAIKRVYQDKKFKNRELEILQEVKDHPYILRMDNHYTTSGDRPGDSYLHIVSELFPETLAQLISRTKRMMKTSVMSDYEPIPLVAIRIYAW